MGFSPQDTARELILSLRAAHVECEGILAMSTTESVNGIKNRVEAICTYMAKAQTALSTLQSAFDNATIATRVANHIEPSPADLPAAWTTARNAFYAMADDYAANVMTDMGAPWVFNGTTRRHEVKTYNPFTPANFTANVTALRNALAVFY